MNRRMTHSLRIMSFAAGTFAVAFTLAAPKAQAQQIYVVEGGRTTVTLSKGFLSDLSALKVTPTAVNTSQLYGNKIYFPITSGAVSLDTAEGQILHSGGVTLTAGTKSVKLESFILNTIPDKPFVSGVVIANGKFVGRLKLFDLTLPSDLKLPLDPSDGDFFLSGVKLTLDEESAIALNEAFGVTAFAGGTEVGYSLSLVLVPLTADGL